MKTWTKSEIIFQDLNNYVQQKIKTIQNRKINYREIKNKKLEKLQQMKNKRTKPESNN
jgi:FtsZ-binding cell division protein ZapB